jgi:hypothetical protein
MEWLMVVIDSYGGLLLGVIVILILIIAFIQGRSIKTSLGRNW